MDLTANERCAVCRDALTPGQERYPNAWEASLKQRPCCGDACVRAFDASVHWMPVRAPEALSEHEADRLVRDTRRRLHEGENPALVARDLLLAGVPTSRVERALRDVAAKTASDARVEPSRLGLFSRLLGSILIVGRTGVEKQEVGRVLDARAEIEAWRVRFEPAPPDEERRHE